MHVRKVKAQILVILLLVLSILSILVLSMVTTARKDSIEEIDNKRYEQFYAYGERRLIQTQESLGTKQYSLEDMNTTLSSQSSACTSQKIIHDGDTGAVDTFVCVFPAESYEVKSSNLDQVQSTLFISDNPILKLYEMNSDSNLRISLWKGNATGMTPYNGGINLFWKSSASQVDWEITVDYYRTPTNNFESAYKSFKVSTVGNQDSLIKANEYDAEAQFPHGISFNISAILTNGGISNDEIKALRIKPLIGSTDKVTISIIPNDIATFPAQFRRLTAVVNSLTNATSPTIILNLEYPVSLPVNSLFDYVLRVNTLEFGN